MRYTTLLVALAISVTACQRADERTRIFSAYLRNTYGVQIPEPLHTYIVFPKNIGCLGCSAHTFAFVTEHRFKNVTLICTPDQTETLPANSGYELLTDSLGEIERLNLQTQNVAIIETQDKKVRRIVSIQANTIDSILNDYFRAKQ